MEAKIKKFIKIILSIVILLLLTTCSSKAATKPASASVSASPSVSVSLVPPRKLGSPEELLSQMTLEEKIGQMTQAERGDILPGDVTKYALGSILSGGGSVPTHNTPEGWTRMINAFTEDSLKTRLGIPVLYGIDAVHGHNNAVNAVILPHNVGLGAIAAGDPELGKKAAYTAGRITAEDMLAAGARWTFAPVLGVAEDVRWGRTYESYGEKVNIVTTMGASFIKGLQDNGAAACMKHFLGEGQTENGRNQGNARLDRSGLARILPPYRAAIEAGALSLMPSFSSINGLKMHQNKELLTDLLKKEMGFKGFIVSDWAAVTQLTGGTYKAQIANAVNAGVDMVMATNGRESWLNFIKFLQELVNEGKVPMERVDDAVLRILRFKQRIDLFDSPYSSEGDIGTDANRAEARKLVSQSLVLLRNENNVVAKLPSYKRVLVAGEGADDIGMQCGGWTITWQGSHGPITKGTTILEGIKDAVKGKADVTYSEDGKAAGNFDAVIAVIGENPYAESDGDRKDNIDIRAEDMSMLKEIYGKKCPVIVIMLSGRPMTIGDEYIKWDAFIAAWLPGTEAAGIADVLFGAADFTAKTPYTWRKSIGGDVLYPYGFGLRK